MVSAFIAVGQLVVDAFASGYTLFVVAVEQVLAGVGGGAFVNYDNVGNDSLGGFGHL